jgi:hypothetical protein
MVGFLPMSGAGMIESYAMFTKAQRSRLDLPGFGD